MHDDRKIIESRITRILETRVRPARYRERVPCSVRCWEAPSRNEPFSRAREGPYRPLGKGDPWGTPWQTVWLEVTGLLPKEWPDSRAELLVDLGFTSHNPGFQAEGLAFDTEGRLLKGVHPDNNWIPLASLAKAGEPVSIFVEAAANPPIMGAGQLVAGTPLGDPDTAGASPIYRFGGAELGLLDEGVAELALDIEVLDGLMRTLALDDPRRHDLLNILDRALDCLDPRDIAAGALVARSVLAEAWSHKAVPSAHHCSAVGHAHIDSAWLWPLAETTRKCARTFANVTSLIDEHPELVFACSQAQQYEWVKEQYPELYERIKQQVEGGQWVPVGGMWVEADTILTGGEALARQLVYGQRFFREEFGAPCQEVWLPDCFGYSGALPQLARLAGARYFLTQKLSWNQTNRFPHHSFIWEGIDGSRVFAHFPPVETYNSRLAPAELAHAVKTYAEHGRGQRSLVPFGYGDGGGGPTREMLGRARRLADIEGAPRVTMEPPSKFFAAAEVEYKSPPVWLGEMYFERHRGTYTSQAGIKRGNRECEHLLREAELWSATAAVTTGYAYPYDELTQIWKTLLLHQFHDILPGSSIAQVNREAVATYKDLKRRLQELIGEAQGALAGQGDEEVVFNAGPYAREGVAAMGAGRSRPVAGPDVTAQRSPGGGIVLDNGLLRAELDADGLVVSLLDLEAGREVIARGGRACLLQLHWDLPNDADAWDVDKFYVNHTEDISRAEKIVLQSEDGQLARIEVTRSFGTSVATQVVSLERGARRLGVEVVVDWDEVERFLKLSFPLAIQAHETIAEIQFGYVRRATHTNTSWEAARFEIFAHRFVYTGEPGYGVAIVNDGTYGYDVSREPREEGGWTTTLRCSLLRGPRFPDPNADHGRHEFRFWLVPRAGISDAIREGYAANLPLRRRLGGVTAVAPLVSIDNPAVVVEALKLADDRSGDIVVRCYEAYGGRAPATFQFGFPASRAALCDLLEEPVQWASLDKQSVTLHLRPFEILTLRVTPSSLAGGQLAQDG